MASVETIRRGYDRFVIVGMDGYSDIREVGRTPVYGTTTVSGQSYGSTFSATGMTTYQGGAPIYGGSHGQELAVRMFRNGDPGSERALDARAELGPQWQEMIKNDKLTCF